MPREGLQVLTTVCHVSPRLHHHEPVHYDVHEGTSEVHKEAESTDRDRTLKLDCSDCPSCRELEETHQHYVAPLACAKDGKSVRDDAIEEFWRPRECHGSR